MLVSKNLHQQCSGSIYVTVARPLLLFVTENILLLKTILSLFPPPFPQVFMTQVCGTVESAPLNSDVQLAGLRLLTNMSVTSDYHQKMINSIPCFLHLLSEGTERTQVLGSVVFKAVHEAALLALFLNILVKWFKLC